MTPTKTIAKKGRKSIINRTQNQEKCRVSVLLTITEDGNKLPSLIIFKAKANGEIEKQLNKDINVTNGKCFINCNDNAWCTEKIMNNWYYLVWDNYLKNGPFFNNDNEGYLILDSAPSHITKNIIYLLKINNREVTFIPPGLTRFLQPLDVAINKPFKQALKEKYNNFCINNGLENKKLQEQKELI